MELDINELLNFSPLMKTFTFNAWVVAGFTPITRGSTLDYYINRPQGMKGYIINLTLRGQARAKAGDGFLLLEEVAGGMAADVAGDEKHDDDARNDDQGQPNAVIHHDAENGQQRNRGDQGLREALADHLGATYRYRWCSNS